MILPISNAIRNRNLALVGGAVSRNVAVFGGAAAKDLTVVEGAGTRDLPVVERAATRDPTPYKPRDLKPYNPMVLTPYKPREDTRYSNVLRNRNMVQSSSPPVIGAKRRIEWKIGCDELNNMSPASKAIYYKGAPVPPVIEGYAYYNDRGDKTKNGNGVTTYSVQCQTEQDRTMDEIVQLKRRIEMKTAQYEDTKRIVMSQEQRIQTLEEQLEALHEHKDHKALLEYDIIKIAVSEGHLCFIPRTHSCSILQAVKRCKFNRLVETAEKRHDRIILLEKELDRMTKRKTCPICRGRIHHRFL